MSVNVEKIVREYIDKTLHLSLATVSGDKPWVCEVHFAYDDDLNLYWRSKADRRHSQEIAANPNVAGNIVAQHELTDSPEAIYFEGTAEMIEDQSKFQALYQLFANRQNVAETIIDDAKQPNGHKFYKVTVENWYAFGKFGGDSNHKHKLAWNGGKR